MIKDMSWDRAMLKRLAGASADEYSYVGMLGQCDVIEETPIDGEEITDDVVKRNFELCRPKHLY